MTFTMFAAMQASANRVVSDDIERGAQHMTRARLRELIGGRAEMTGSELIEIIRKHITAARNRARSGHWSGANEPNRITELRSALLWAQRGEREPEIPALSPIATQVRKLDPAAWGGELSEEEAA